MGVAQGWHFCPAQGWNNERAPEAHSVPRQDMEGQGFRGRTPQAHPAMILVDTSVIVAWLDATHPDHAVCAAALRRHAGEDQLAVSCVTYAELAAGGRTREAIDE